MSWSFLLDCTSLGYEPKQLLGSLGFLGSPSCGCRLLASMEQRRRRQQQRSRERKEQAEAPAPQPQVKIGLHPNLMKAAEPVAASLPEAMRNLELPQLPSPSAENAALLFGDWLTVITPLMEDLSTSSTEFWEWVQREVEITYHEWLLASPLARLRSRVEEQVSPRFQRLDQRASSTFR